MHLKRLLTGVAFATALTLGSVVGAQAVPVVTNYSLFDPLEPDSADSVQQCFNLSAASKCVAERGGHNFTGEFQDNYSIDVVDTTNVTFTAAPANPIRPSITGFLLELLQGTTVVASATNFADFVYEVLAGQSYTLRVSGTAPNGSSYTVDVSGACPENDPNCGGSVTPVPVPGALPLLASGLAGLGFLHRRRRQALRKA